MTTPTSTQELLDRLTKIRKDPIEFLRAVRTLDEVDKKKPIKHFPISLEYLQWYVRLWQREDFIAVPKSRRMKMSWINISLFLWDTLFNRGRNYAFVSKKEADSDELVKRAVFIYKNLDHSIIPKELLPKMEDKFCEISFPQMNSRIRGYPSGADQLRQYTFSGILGDECAFWPDAQEMYSGSIPTLEGGGRFVMISSRSPGFFKRLVYDQLNNTTDDFDTESVRNKKILTPMPGLEIWKNPLNRFTVFELHYTADPAKRDPAWKTLNKAKMPAKDWDMEYEKSWDSYSGLPVYSDWDETRHGARGLEPENGLPLLRGWDFGLTPACVITQLQKETLVVLKEFTGLNIGTDRFSDQVLPQCEVLFPNFKWIDFIDPAGTYRDESAEGTSAKILDSKGLNCIPGIQAPEARRKAVEKFLLTTSATGPHLQVDMANCPVLVRGFAGGYRYPESALEREPTKLRPLKDEHSHPHDALQYICTGILTMLRKFSPKTIPHPTYTFTNSKNNLNLKPVRNF